MINTLNRDKGPDGSENPGFGCNKYTFWVCNNGKQIKHYLF